MPIFKKIVVPNHLPHFDAQISEAKARRLVSSPASVSSHAFLPLLSYEIRWFPFGKRGNIDDLKKRPIRYAAKRDSFIFRSYREKLAQLYEVRLADLELTANVLAYRRVPLLGTNRNKSNVQFARDAFSMLRAMAPCHALCLDIKSFFESLDHQKLKAAWAGLLGVTRLPDDHFAVFRAATSYIYVDRIEAYKALGIIGTKIDSTGKKSVGFTVAYKDMPKQLCNPATFRKVIKPLSKRNDNAYGVPQGLPISDLLSNLYLLEFDQSVKAIVAASGGEYYRYSDDILVLLPSAIDHESVEAAIVAEVRKSGPQMTVKASKCSTHRCCIDASGTSGITQVKPVSERTGLEYLGYRFDGVRTYIRSSTLSRLHRRVTMSVRNHVRDLIAANQFADISQLRASLNPNLIHSRFGRRPENVERSTFFSYAKRSNEEQKVVNSRAVKQVRRLKEIINRRAERELIKQHKHKKP